MPSEPVPGSGAEASSATSVAENQVENDPVEAALRQMVDEEQNGGISPDKPKSGRLASLLERLKSIKPPDVSLPKPHMPNIPKPHMPDISMPNIPRPDLSGIKEKVGNLPKPHMPDLHMPNVQTPDLSGVGEAIDSSKVGGFLKRSVESYLNKFNPTSKDKKAWALGIAAGAGSVVAAAEFGATLGLSPALRGLAIFAILNTSDFLYSRLHNFKLRGALGNLEGESKKGEFRKQVVNLEKTVAAKGLKGQAFIDAYKEELSNLRRQSFDISDPTIINDTGLDEEQINKLLKLGTDYAVVNSTARSLAAGMSAGSFMGAMGEVGIRSFLKGSVVGALSENYTAPQAQMPSVQAPEVSLPQMPQVEIPNVELPHLEMPQVQMPEINNPFDQVPSVPHPADSLPDLTDKITSIEATPEYQTGIAAEVGKYLPARDEIVSEALKAKGILPAEIDISSFDAGREAALHVMEGKGNEIFDSALKEALSADPDAGIAKATEIAQNAYADWLESTDAHTQIAEAAQNAIADHLQIENSLAEKVINTIATNQDWFQEVPIDRGATVGKILNLTWTPSDAPVMGANIAANYDMLTDMWGQMAQVRPDLLSNGNFPVSLSEINNLVARAELGDQEAIKKLRLALHWIPAGSKFRAVAANASREVLKLVA